VVDPTPQANLSVTPLSIQRVPAEKQERVAVTAGVSNRGAEAASNVKVDLEVDGRVVQSATVNVAAGSSASTTFVPIVFTGTAMRVSTRIPDDALAIDNVFHSIVTPPQALPVMLAGTGARGDSDLYLSRALAIGDRPRFQVTTHGLEALTSEALARARVVVLQDAPLAEALAARLEKFVAEGGGLIVALGPRATLPPSAEWLPVTLGGIEDRTRGASAKLSGFDYGHAVFEPFRAPRSGDFSTARIYGYRMLTGKPGTTTLARFDTGTPALVESTVGRGRVLVLGTTLDLLWNDLALKPVYLPFVHQLVRQASSYVEQPGWVTVGQAVNIAGAGPAPAADIPPLVLSPSGERLAAENGSSAMEMREPGFYEVRDAREGQPLRVVASNVDLSESDTARVDASEVSVAVTGQPGTGALNGGAVVIPDTVQEQAQRMWWYLLFAGILILIAESWLARRHAPSRRQGGAV
jgi:hypothetical protein